MKKRRFGFTLLELLIAVAIITTILMFAIPSYEGALQKTNATAALAAVRTLNTAQVQYYSHYGKWASSLAELAPPQSGRPSAAAAKLIAGDIAMGEKNGYRFRVTAEAEGYTIRAEPVKGGGRNFFSDQTMVIRESPGPEPATADSPEVK